jgi:hypothetical protein
MVSSKAARLRRRQAARCKRERRLGRPVHTRTERRRRELERQAEREAHRKVTRRLKGAATVTATGFAATTVVTLAPTEVSPVPDLYQGYLSAQSLAAVAGRAEIAHNDGPDPTVYQDGFHTAGTAVSTHYSLRSSGGVNPPLPLWTAPSAAHGACSRSALDKRQMRKFARTLDGWRRERSAR